MARSKSAVIRGRIVPPVSLLMMEVLVVCFNPTPQKQAQHKDGAHFESGECFLIPEVAIQSVLNQIGRRGDQNSKLISKTRHQSPRATTPQFIQINSTHPPPS